VTLELGGKSPVYVDKSAKIDVAVSRISAAKWINTGQTCVAPDYIMVHKSVVHEFSEKMTSKIAQEFGDAEHNPRGKLFARVINQRHAQRLAGYVQDTKGTVLAGGLATVDDAKHFVPPTLVLNPTLGDTLMTEEIFGPVLPILQVGGEEEAIQIIHQVCDRPLALYVYAEDQAVVEKVLSRTSSGGVAVNSSMEQLILQELPFGGVGESGMGAYHGKFGFEEFSHRRAVLYKDTTFLKGWGMLEAIPSAAPDKMYDLAIKAQVTGFLTPLQTKGVLGAAAVLAGAIGCNLIRSRL